MIHAYGATERLILSLQYALTRLQIASVHDGVLKSGSSKEQWAGEH